MKILVCGDRKWSDKLAIYRRLSKFSPGTHIIHGACRGADRLAGKAAEELGFTVIAVPAKWHRYGGRRTGNPAGPIRNREMLAMNPDLVIAFHADLSRSKGTAGMKALAEEAGISVEIIKG